MREQHPVQDSEKALSRQPFDAPSQQVPHVVAPEQSSPSGTPASRQRRVGGWWYYLVTLVTMGLMTWIPFVHAAVRLRTARARTLAAVFGALDVLIYVLLVLTPKDAQGNAVTSPIGTVGGLLCLTSMIGGCVWLASLRRQAPAAEPMPAAPAPTSTPTPALAPAHQADIDPAVGAVLGARRRRAEARQLIAQDVLMARELRIGRPDLPRDYDDGGLVDLNSAPAQAIADTCDIPLTSAEILVAAREKHLEPFFNVDEILISAEIPVSQWDRIRDRAVLLP